MEKNYVELTGRLHRWEERAARNGTVYGRGWIEVPRSGGDGTTKFPLLSFDAGGWKELVGSVVTLSGHLVWSREYDDDGTERFVVMVHVNVMTFVRSGRGDGNGAKSGKSSKSSKPVARSNGAKSDSRKAETTDNEDDFPF